jgi:uncharacterized membrane protein YhhN
VLPLSANLALLGAVPLSAAACIAGYSLERRSLVYVFKPLTMLLVLALAAQGRAVGPAYTGLVLAGLACSLAGDVFLMLPRDRFLPGLASFLAGHLFFAAAFAAAGGAAGPPAAFLPFAAAGALVYAWLRPGLGRLALPVAIYAAAIALMAGLAAARWLAVGGVGALLACAGATLFVVSDALLATNRFRRPLRAAQAQILGSYFAGQCLIALSTGVGEALLGAR